jgi:phosphohistidine phosphatase
MKSLTILRHAKSSWAEPGQQDFDRPLNERGHSAARRMGRELKHRQIHFDVVLASAAVRVQETLEEFFEGYGEELEVGVEAQIYEADVHTLLSLVREIPDSGATAMLVGHNPGLHRLVLELSRDDPAGLRERVESKFPTAAAAVIDLDVETWTDVAPACGLIRALILPKELD